MTTVLIRHADGTTEATGDWLGLIDVTDDEARAYAAEKFGVTPEEIELVRDEAIIKVRKKPAADCSHGGGHKEGGG